jgi:ribosomal protein L11 methyltransferase
MYIEHTLYPLNGATDALCGVLDELGLGYSVDDPDEIAALLDETKAFWDYFDEALTAPRAVAVKLYLQPDAPLPDAIKPLCERIAVKPVQEDDWANAWKPYWQATLIGENLVIVPSWKTVLRLDPGMLFGTGAHATTALCLEAAEHVFADADVGGRQIGKVLDLGCGSGILSIAALLLGAQSALGFDIDPNMPRIAAANAAMNGVKPTFEAVDIFSAELGGGYDLVFANIVADVLIRFAPKVSDILAERGTFICSGIIAPRLDEVRSKLTAAGLNITDVQERDEWAMLAGQLARLE